MVEPSSPLAQTAQDPLQAEKLALERDRLRTERQKLALDIRLKRRELGDHGGKTWKELFANPLTLAIVGGFLSIITTLATTWFTAESNREGAKQALQAELIKKFVEAPKTETVRENLRFLVDAGLLPNYATGITDYLAKNPDSAPAISSPLVGGIVGSTDQRVALDKMAELPRKKFLGVGIVRTNGSVFCTGFMVSPRLLATAQYCLSQASLESRSIKPVMTFDLAPISTDPAEKPKSFEIDTTDPLILKRSGTENTSVAIALVPLKDRSASLPYLLLDPVPPVQGAQLEAVFFAADRSAWVYSSGTNCRALSIDEEELHHLCDTGVGSSGAPLLSPSGKVIGVHAGLGKGQKQAIRTDSIARNPEVVSRFGELPTRAWSSSELR